VIRWLKRNVRTSTLPAGSSAGLFLWSTQIPDFPRTLRPGADVVPLTEGNTDGRDIASAQTARREVWK
jgi:hypothetical protein